MIVDERLRGTITAVGAATGDRVVVGAWNTSPIGRFADVMWVRPDGRHALLTPHQRVADYVSSIYAFEEHRVVDFTWGASPTRTSVTAGPVEVVVTAAGGARVPVPRPWWITRRAEGPLARRLMGVETHGVSPRGAEEWYQARAWRWVDFGRVAFDGVDAGPIGPARPALRVGFSEPPPRASITDVAVRVRRRV